MPTLYQIVTISLISAFIVLLIDKTGLRDFVVERSYRLISRLFECDFCLSFWTNMLVCLVLVAITGNFTLLIIPFMSSPITRFLL